MKLEQFLQSLENIGLTKCDSHYDDFVQKYSFSDCGFAFITVWKSIRKCIIWSDVHIIDDEIRVTGLDKHQYDIDSEGSVIITKLKELENDFEPSMWSKLVNEVHKLLRNLWSLLNKQDTWYLIALLPLFCGMFYSGYKIFYMIFSFFMNL